METLIEGVIGLGAEPGRIVMMLIGAILMYLGIKKEYEPTLLVPMGLGTILVNIPNTGVLMTGGEAGPFQVLFEAGIETELFPLLLFIGIGAMIDFGPLLSNPFLLLFGAAAQFGIFFSSSWRCSPASISPTPPRSASSPRRTDLHLSL